MYYEDLHQCLKNTNSISTAIRKYEHDFEGGARNKYLRTTYNDWEYMGGGDTKSFFKKLFDKNPNGSNAVGISKPHNIASSRQELANKGINTRPIEKALDSSPQNNSIPVPGSDMAPPPAPTIGTPFKMLKPQPPTPPPRKRSIPVPSADMVPPTPKLVTPLKMNKPPPYESSERLDQPMVEPFTAAPPYESSERLDQPMVEPFTAAPPYESSERLDQPMVEPFIAAPPYESSERLDQPMVEPFIAAPPYESSEPKKDEDLPMASMIEPFKAEIPMDAIPFATIEPEKEQSAPFEKEDSGPVEYSAPFENKESDPVEYSAPFENKESDPVEYSAPVKYGKNAPVHMTPNTQVCPFPKKYFLAVNAGDLKPLNHSPQLDHLVYQMYPDFMERQVVNWDFSQVQEVLDNSIAVNHLYLMTGRQLLRSNARSIPSVSRIQYQFAKLVLPCAGYFQLQFVIHPAQLDRLDVFCTHLQPLKNLGLLLSK
jgi:hypothetical protein